MVAVTVVSLIQVVGIILVIALFTLPAAIASQFVGSVDGYGRATFDENALLLLGLIVAV